MSHEDACPHCGSVDEWGRIGGPDSRDPWVCLRCGYDDENGTAGVCPGGFHPCGRHVLCCDACWKRIPRDLPGQDRWRSRLRTARATHAWGAMEDIFVAARSWLAENPATTVR